MGIQEGIAFGVGLHDGVLHSVVNRFDEVTRTKGTDVSVRLGGGESAQNGQDPGDVSWFSASGESVARLPSPLTATDSDVAQPDTVGREFFCPSAGVAKVAVSTVNDEITSGQVRRQLLKRAFGDGAGRQHEPHRSGRWEFGDEFCDAGGRGREVAEFGGAVSSVRIDIESDHVVDVVDQASHHRASHRPESDQAKFHAGGS